MYKDKIIEIICQTCKTPEEQAEEIMLLFGVSERFCPICTATTRYDVDLEMYKCNECEWEE